MSKQSKIPSEKAQSKKPDKTKSEAWMSRWDWDRQAGPDLRDPRNAGPPCEGTHSPAPMGRGSPSGCNAHGLWVTCSRCSMRLSYTPAIGAKATYRASPPLAADVKATLKEKGSNAAPSELTTQSISVDAAERSLLQRLERVQAEKKEIRKKQEEKKPVETIEIEDQTDAKMRGYPSRKTSKRENTELPENQDQNDWTDVTANAGTPP